MAKFNNILKTTAWMKIAKFDYMLKIIVSYVCSCKVMIFRKVGREDR